MKLTEEEKTALRDAAESPAESFSPRRIPAPLSPERYLQQLELWAELLPRPQKPAPFEGSAWRL
jgi:hypothetical protein